MDDKYISLAHGNGGRYMRELIAEIFARHLSDPDRDDALDVTLDAAPISLAEGGEPFMTTDGFIVQPLEFPGGDIGSLAVNGTVNDLAVSGATPKYLSLNAFIEEGLEIATLDRIVQSLAAAAGEAGVQVVAGDITPIEEIGVIGAREMYRALGTPLEAMAESVREMKSVATSILTGSDAEEAGFYFDYVIGALS